MAIALDTLFGTLGLDPVNGLELLDAGQLDYRLPAGDLPTVITQMRSRAMASSAKQALMERYPVDHPVVLVRAVGVEGEEQRVSIPLHELDCFDWVDYLTTLYLPPLKRSRVGDVDPRRWTPMRWPLDPLVEVMARLRSAEGCPWDREQTFQTLRQYMLEEAYEAVEAAAQDDARHFCEELGDVLLQVVFNAQIAREHGEFDIHDVIAGITAKLVRRHPHIFGDVEVATAEDVTRNWEAIKQAEKAERGEKRPTSLLDGVSKAQPALSQARDVQKRAAKVGFDWEDLSGPADKVREELAEVLAAPADELEGEVGDLLFAAVNLARKLGVDPEAALVKTLSKFTRRFQYIERRAAEKGQRLSDMGLFEMDLLWREAKSGEVDQKMR